jgi:hypothetical protein
MRTGRCSAGHWQALGPPRTALPSVGVADRAAYPAAPACRPLVPKTGRCASGVRSSPSGSPAPQDALQEKR